MSGVVAFTLLWPLAHAGLVARYRIDPWELFGWSMYALPAARVQIRVEVERGGETQALRPMRAMRRRVRDFARLRTALGSLASTEPLALAIFAEDPTIDALTILTREILLDRESTHLVARDEAYRHDRDFTDSNAASRSRDPRHTE
jgi:hypothetical protein